MRKIVLILTVLLLIVTTCSQKNAVKITVVNNLDFERQNEIVEVDWSKIKSNLAGDLSKTLLISSINSDQTLLTQRVDNNQDDKTDKLLFKCSIPANSQKSYVIQLGSEKQQKQTDSLVYGRFVPERKDDFAWENDKVAFRTYGPALELESSGIDVWSKKVEYPIIDKWYEKGHYHEDHGEGADFYKVGNSLGCGAPGIEYQDSIKSSNNYEDWEIISKGPLRFKFKLSYNNLEVNDKSIPEERIISLDVGSYLNHIIVDFGSNNSVSTNIITGLNRHKNFEKIVDNDDNVIGLWEKIDDKNGYLGTGIVPGKSNVDQLYSDFGHEIMKFSSGINKKVEYYAGACWSKGKDINSKSEWKSYLQKYQKKLLNPLKVKFK